MSNGWDDGGTDRLICSIAGETGLAGEGIVPLVPGASASGGVYTGTERYTPSTTTGMPTIAIGTSDFSMEWMLRGRSEDSDVGTEDTAHSGLVTATEGDTVGVLQLGLICSDLSQSNLQVRLNPGVSGTTLTHPGSARWSHIGMSVDRSDLMRSYLNGVAGATVDVSSQVATSYAAVPIHPLQASHIGGYDANDDDHDTVDSVMCYLSSFAIHSRILTAAEMLTNSNAKIVGLYNETLVRYLFKTFVDGSGAAVVPTKTTLAAKISIFCKFALSEPEASEHYAPRVANGGLFIEDTSGNARHYPCRTGASYTTTGTEGTRGGTCFADSGAW